MRSKRTAYGLDTPRDNWMPLARCAQPDLDANLWSRPSHAGIAAHICLYHCPVLAECEAHTPKDRDLRRSTVYAGVVYNVLGVATPAKAERRCPLCLTLAQRRELMKAVA